MIDIHSFIQQNFFQFYKDSFPYLEDNRLIIPGFNGSVRSLTHLNSIYNRQKVFPSRSSYSMPDRPQTISAGFSTRLGLKSRRRMSDSFDRDNWSWQDSNYRQSWCDTTSDRIRPYSTSYSVPNHEKHSNSSSPIKEVHEYEIDWQKPDEFNHWDKKINEIELALNASRTYKERNFDRNGVYDDIDSSGKLELPCHTAVGPTLDKNHGGNKFKLSSLWPKKKNQSLSQIEEEHYMNINKNDDSIFICTKSCEAENPGELSMKKGEIVEGFNLLTFIA